MLQQINEQQILEEWKPILEEKFGTSINEEKKTWLSKYCHYHSLNEGFSFPQASPANVPGMGNIAFPGNPTGGSGFYTATTGSGDKFPTLLPLAMQVAARTVGFDIVPVIPMAGPAGVLPYMDYVYAGGRTDTAEKPLIIAINIPDSLLGSALVIGNSYFLTNGTTTTGAANDLRITVKYVGKSRIDGHKIFQVIKNSDYSSNGTVWSQLPADSITLSQVLDGSATLYVNNAGAVGALVNTAAGNITGTARLVNALEDHIQGFSGAGNNDTSAWSSQFDGTTSAQPMLRGVGETAGYRTLGTKVYTKAVDAETFQVSTVVTTEQIQDLNKQFGIDLVSMVQNALVNDISQSINKHILTRAFALGWQNTYEFNATENVNLNVSLDSTYTSGSRNTPSYQVANSATAVSMGIPYYANFGSFENMNTLQRRLYSKVLGAANMITTRGRRGPANFIVTNGALATALQDCAGYVAAPMTNTINQTNGNLYPVGSISGMMVYVDPNMGWADNRILIGRKGADEEPGLKFCVYLMAESIQTIAEGTMSPKIAVKSRYALVEAGFHPQTQYATIHVDLPVGGIF